MARRVPFWLSIAIFVVACVACGGAIAGEVELQTQLASIRLSAPGVLTIAGQPVDRVSLHEFYAARSYALAWDAGTVGLGDRAAIVVSVLASADAEGLDPADYHLKEIVGLAAADTPAARWRRDLLITDGLLRYVADVAGGKLTPRETDERVVVRRDMRPRDCVAFATVASLDALQGLLERLPPDTLQYRALKDMLARLARFQESGGWKALPDGGVLHPGEHDSAIPALRQRMQAEGRLVGIAKSGWDYYDPALSASVAQFQREHALKPDGTVGKDTRAALDMPVEARLRQVAVNMERARWADPPGEGRRVEVNLAAYSLNVYQDGQSLLSMPVVVGTKENPTPILASRITAVVLNPNWTLPPAVIKEILPRLREDRGYLAARGIAREESDGKVRLVQPPGPTNPLGHYKFVIPNDQDIYLHDSPDSRKFHYENRAYSHGCVRLGDPAALANLLLDDQMSRFPDGLDGVIQTGDTRHIALVKPVPVSLVYRTAWLDAEGRLVLGQDGYGRDELLWTALHKPRRSGAKRIADRLGQSNAL